VALRRFFLFFTDPTTPGTYTLSLHDALPISILGKIVGGGLPLAAFGGRAEIMDCLAPSGDVYQAGTLSGNPLATAAGLADCPTRSEEHTSELQSRENLVCRLLLEKKKQIQEP